jgi:hypothetical protein
LIVKPVLLEPGQFLGTYQIVSFLAVGGMGEVYRARDTKLSRLPVAAVDSSSPRWKSARTETGPERSLFNRIMGIVHCFQRVRLFRQYGVVGFFGLAKIVPPRLEMERAFCR